MGRQFPCAHSHLPWAGRARSDEYSLQAPLLARGSSSGSSVVFKNRARKGSQDQP